jgi:hypothetical protein
LSLASRRQDAGDLLGAERFHQMGVDRGHYWEMVELAGLRVMVDDREGAERLYKMAADHGEEIGVTLLASMWEHDGKLFQARQLRLYGLTDEGGIAESWD